MSLTEINRYNKATYLVTKRNKVISLWLYLSLAFANALSLHSESAKLMIYSYGEKIKTSTSLP